MASSAKASEWEHSLFILGEILHMPVYQIKAEMPLAELIGWLSYFNKKNKPAEKEPDGMEIIRAFGC